jgi:1-deoxy-D-xylulose-5-phosphate synthase
MAAAELLEGQSVPSDCYNLRFLKPVDEDYLTDIMNRYELAVVIEEGVGGGGFGEYISALALRRNWAARLLCLAAGDGLYPQGKREELLQKAGLDGRGIANRVSGVYYSKNGMVSTINRSF